MNPETGYPDLNRPPIMKRIPLKMQCITLEKYKVTTTFRNVKLYF